LRTNIADRIDATCNYYNPVLYRKSINTINFSIKNHILNILIIEMHVQFLNRKILDIVEII